MRIYKLYLRVKQEEYDSFFHLIIPNWYYYDFYEKDNRFIGLYAWTDSKEILYQFFEFRKLKRFWIDKVKMSKKEFETFRVEQKEFQLVEEEIYDETFILPIHERETICNTGSEMLAEYIQRYGYDYEFFQEKFIESLDSMGYTTYFDLYVGGDPDFVTLECIQERMETSDYNLSFGLTTNGNVLYRLDEDPIGLFLLFYKNTLNDDAKRRLEGLKE